MVLDKDVVLCKLDYSEAQEQSDAMRITLTWTNNSGFFKRIFGRGSLDIDLGCYYLMDNGDKLLIDALQFSEDYGTRNQSTRQGCYTAPPYIWHEGDNRGMGKISMETILVNPQGLDRISKIMVYAYMYDGLSRWDEAQAYLTISVPGRDDVIVKVDCSGNERLCAIAAIDIDPEAKTLNISSLGTFHSGHATCDKHYGWGFTYYKSKQVGITN